MPFWSHRISRYLAVDSDPEEEDPQLRLKCPAVSRHALIAFILISQILVLVSSNLAAYTLGRTQLLKSLKSAPQMIKSERIGGPQGASADCHHIILLY